MCPNFYQEIENFILRNAPLTNKRQVCSSYIVMMMTAMNKMICVERRSLTAFTMFLICLFEHREACRNMQRILLCLTATRVVFYEFLVNNRWRIVSSAAQKIKSDETAHKTFNFFFDKLVFVVNEGKCTPFTRATCIEHFQVWPLFLMVFIQWSGFGVSKVVFMRHATSFLFSFMSNLIRQ